MSLNYTSMSQKSEVDAAMWDAAINRKIETTPIHEVKEERVRITVNWVSISVIVFIVVLVLTVTIR